MKLKAYILLCFAAVTIGLLVAGLHATLLAIYITCAAAYILWQAWTGDLGE